MEIWDLYNDQGEKLDKTVIRGHELPKDTYHLVVHIIITNSEGDFLIQKRADIKDILPGIWAFTGGSAIEGEISEIAAIRELSEETGIYLKVGDLKFLKRLFYHTSMADIYHAVVDADVSKLEFQVEEVSQLAYESQETIMSMIENGSFHKYRDRYFEVVFNTGGKYVRK